MKIGSGLSASGFSRAPGNLQKLGTGQAQANSKPQSNQKFAPPPPPQDTALQKSESSAQSSKTQGAQKFGPPPPPPPPPHPDMQGMKFEGEKSSGSSTSSQGSKTQGTRKFGPPPPPPPKQDAIKQLQLSQNLSALKSLGLGQ